MSVELENTSNVKDQSELTEDDLVKKKITPKYKVISIEKTETPEGMIGDDWYQYIIGQGNAKIEGLKSGTLKEVTLHAEIFVEDLNVRSKGKYSNHVSRQQKVAAPTKTPADTK